MAAMTQIAEAGHQKQLASGGNSTFSPSVNLQPTSEVGCPDQHSVAALDHIKTLHNMA
jgi:hypothetical protein